jgi:hypothetical protein
MNETRGKRRGGGVPVSNPSVEPSCRADAETERDVELLRLVADLLRTGRVGDLVHESWSERVDELAERMAKRGGLVG